MAMPNPAATLARRPAAPFSAAAGASPMARLIPGVAEMRRALDYAPRPLPALSDPAHNVDAEPTGTDFRNDPRAAYEAQIAENERRRLLLSLCDRRFTAGKAMQSPMNGYWYEGEALFLNRPWHLWNARTGNFRDMRDPNALAHNRRYTSRNITKPKVLNAAAHVCQMAPEVGVSPATQSPLDVEAAHEMRQVRTSLDHKFDRDAQTFNTVLLSKISGPPLLKVTYDPSAHAEMPLMGPDGQVQQVFRAQVGDIEESIVKAGQWFGPGGDFDKMAWLIHARPEQISVIRETWPDGYAVTPEAGAQSDTAIDLLMASSDGEYQRGSGMAEADSVILKELWEKPTTRYPGGRWIVWAGNVVLHEGAWPYPEMAERGWFPFVPLYHLRLPGSLWGENMVSDLVDPQRSINERMSRALEHAALPPFNIVAYNGAQISRGAWKGSDSQIIDVVGPNSSVEVQTKPPMDKVTMDVLGLEKDFFNTISMTAQVSEGIAPYSGMSAEQTQALQSADMKSSEAELTALRSYLVRVAELEQVLVKQFYTQPRMAVTAPGQPDAPATAPLTFRALQDGGRVYIDAAANSPHTPAAKIGFLSSLAAQGGFQAQNLGATKMLLKASDMFGDDDDFFDELDQMITQAQQQIAAQTPNPAMIQQMKAQQAQQQQQADQAHEQTMLALQDHIEANKAHYEEEHDKVMAAVQHHTEQEMAAIELHSKEELARQAAGNAQALAQVNSNLEALLKMIPSIAGAMDPTAVLDWEKTKLGLEGEVPPVPTATPAGKPKGKAAN